MNVKIKRVRDGAIPPKYATDGAAGFDLYAAKDVIIEPGETVIVPTGWTFEIPRGYEMQIRPRSGITVRTKLRIANSPGTVDRDFRGEVGIIVDHTGQDRSLGGGYLFTVTGGITHVSTCLYEWDNFENGSHFIRKGDRIAQGVLAPVERAAFEVVEELTGTKRGAAGYGSTGTNDEREDE